MAEFLITVQGVADHHGQYTFMRAGSKKPPVTRTYDAVWAKPTTVELRLLVLMAGLHHLQDMMLTHYVGEDWPSRKDWRLFSFKPDVLTVVLDNPIAALLLTKTGNESGLRYIPMRDYIIQFFSQFSNVLIDASGVALADTTPATLEA